MRTSHRTLLLIVVLTFILPLLALPSVQAEAQGKQITITITEAQLNKYLPSVKPRDAKRISADIIDGGVIVKVFTYWSDLPEIDEHFGVLIRDGKIVTEAGKIDLPGIGSLGYADIKKLIPELIPLLDSDARIMGRYVLRQVTAKAGTKYTPVSVTTGDDKIVIVVTK